MEENNAFEFNTKKGNVVNVRYPQKGDEIVMMEYINTLSKEQTFIRAQGEEYTLEEETIYLHNQLEKIAKKETVQLLAFCNNKLIGIAAIDMQDKTESHRGVLGISLADDYRGEGIGKLLLEQILKEAERNLPNLYIVTLEVFGVNNIALQLYISFGFKEYGRLPNGIRYKEDYVDDVMMYKIIRPL